MLTEHIKNVLNGQPVYELEIPYVEGAMQDLLFPPSESGVVFEDSDHLPAKGCDVFVIGDDMVSTQPDNLDEVDVIIPEGRMPQDLVYRITNMIKERQKVLTQKMVWFTFSVENRDCYGDWPVAAYRFGASNRTCYNVPKVAPAVKRLMNRHVIQGIKVTGPIPQHWYFGPIDHSE